MRTENPPSPVSPKVPRSRSWLSGIAAKSALVIGLSLFGAGAVVAPAQAANPHERGPDPTERSVTASRGHLDTDTTSVSSFVSGFGGGTIYHPTNTDEGTYGGVVIAPGYTASSTSMSWYGHRIASQGFVVFTIDTNTRYDQPDSRGRQLDSALDYLVDRSDVRGMVDEDRLAVMGHSMGGGGTLAIAEDRPELRAAIPLTPWHLQKRWGDLETPTLIIGAENDSVASVRSHSIPMYESLDRSLDSAYLELRGASHFAPNYSNTTIAKYSISWLKRFVDDDVRYDQFLCPPPRTGFGTDFSDYRDTCPHGG
ncbi:lipase [Nocardiopsis terrae]|uniref:Poly(ethylene terephthalate) hydrolase n=1 Tax=Nocardiopsis terrae TaxID=372655 RepID=A0ABR9HP34_9ACTN|nr:alpha/beta hydrolase [Nocardiopsis terrae]MBE1460620.1 dipeptidyl aminopeptidase/acylaminoacyl peptidase [Nocardiopsis terrae]GHC72477.1 lipase [Nocardiopsis terrae]